MDISPWLTEATDGDEYEAVQRGMAKTYNGDPAVQDRTRIMRLPGFMHTASGKEVTYTVQGKPYKWEEIIHHFPPMYPEVKEKAPVTVKPPLDVMEHTMSILSAKEIYPSCMPLAFSLLNRNMTPRDVKSHILGLLEITLKLMPTSDTPERVAKAKAQINNFVDTAVGKLNRERARKYIEEDFGSEFTTLDWPVGRVGDVAKWINSTMVYPSPTIAIPTAYFIVSLLGGGCYHYEGTSVARVRTILADNGRGKQSASDAALAIIDSLGMYGLSEDFIMQESHSPLNYQIDINKHKVRGMINSEAGLLASSSSGDQKNKAAWKLKAISQQIGGSPLTVVNLSKRPTNGVLPEPADPIYDPIFLLLDESTPETYLPNAMKELHTESGSLARSELFFVPPEDYWNEEFYTNRTVPGHIVDLFTALVNQYRGADIKPGTSRSCTKGMISADFSAVTARLRDLTHKNVQHRKDTHGDPLGRALCVRYMEKIKTTCLALAIADSCDLGSTKPRPPVVTDAHLDSALEYHDEINRAVLANSRKGSMASTIERAMNKLIGELKRDPDPDYLHLGKDGEITHGWLSRKFRAGDNIIRSLEQQYRCKPKQARYMITDEAIAKGILAPAGTDKWINLVKGE